jgi:hypothetical protein
MSTEQAKPSYADRPKKLRLYTLRVDRIEASSKYEGKWVVNGSVANMKAEHDSTPVKLWMTHKQANSIQRNLDSPRGLFAVLDVVNAEKPRFVWASGDQAWLAKAFLEHPEHDLGVPATDFATSDWGQFQSVNAESKKPFSKPMEETRFMQDDEELPF